MVQRMLPGRLPANPKTSATKSLDRFESGQVVQSSQIQFQREQRYRDLGLRLQGVLEGSSCKAPPNWAALALRPTRQVRQLLQFMEGNWGQLWPTLAGPALADPAVVLSCAVRAAQLLHKGPARIFGQFRDFLLEGSRAIEASLAPRLMRFLEWQQARPAGREDSASLLQWLGRGPQEAVHLLDPSAEFENLDDCCAASLLLYHQACCRPDQRIELIERANRLLLYAEQKLVLQPIYQRYPDLEPFFQLLTPFVQLKPEWSLYGYAGPEAVQEKNWSHWEDRWPAVLDYARTSAQQPLRFWSEGYTL